MDYLDSSQTLSIRPKAGRTLRSFIQNETKIEGYVDFTEVQIFEGATTYPIILLLSKNKEGGNNLLSHKDSKGNAGGCDNKFCANKSS